MQAVAKHNNCPLSPRKMRLVADQIRGQQVNKALYTLRFNQKPTYAAYIEKVLRSAIANWEQVNEERADVDSGLVVKEVTINQGRTLKRIKPAPQGRAHRIRKRSNHITVVVDFPDADVEVEETEEVNEENA